MRDYPDPKHYLDTHIKRSAEKYADGLQRAGLEPNAKLTRALYERAIREASDGYIQEAKAVRDHNINEMNKIIKAQGQFIIAAKRDRDQAIKEVIKAHKKRMNAIKREGWSLRLKACPPIILLFSVLAWYSFCHSDGFLVGICYIVGAGAFLAMLVLGAIFDKPTS